ncbi:MAG TPA: transposase [Candidatus Acidoferrum sp.]|nr:transposase [Candidatus Acidoferrum sp.]
MSTKRSDEDQGHHEHWIEDETKGCEFPDVRLTKRFGNLLGIMARRVGDTIPAACQDWANTKPAYRFLANPRVTEEHVLARHLAATAERAFAVDGLLLVLHDTCEFSYERGEACSLGLLSKPSNGRRKDGSLRHHTARGILMHSSLVVTPQGLPLGLAAIRF